MRKLVLRVELGSSWVAGRIAERRGFLRPVELPGPRAIAVHGQDKASLADALAMAASDLLRQGARLERACLEAQLGMGHARVGLMRLATSDKGPVPAALLQTYVAGWVQQMLHLSPDTQLIRWQVLRDPRCVLVSCVERSAIAALLRFADDHKLKFTTCLPAAMLAVREGRQLGSRTLLWTEGIGNQRDACLQMFRFEHGQPSASWRGWVALSPGALPLDAEADAALRRFHAGHAAPAEHETLHRHWPLSSAPVAA